MRLSRIVLPALLLLAAAFSSCKKEESISASTEVLESDYTGADISITIQATSPWKVVANYAPLSEHDKATFQQPVWYIPIAVPVPETGWIIPDIQEGEGGTTTLNIHVEATTGNSRYGSLIFRLQDEEQLVVVRVYQQGKQDRDMSDKLSAGMVQFLGEGNTTYGHILGIKTLYINDQPFDFSGDLVYFENLQELHCSNSGLTAINVEMPHLRVLRMNDSKVKRLDPALFPSLEFLDCSGNPLESLDILKAPKLQQVICNRIPVKVLALGSQLTYVTLQNCGLERLDLSRAAGLTELDCAYNDLVNLDLTGTAVTRLDCSHNEQLSSLVLPKSGLKWMSASHCGLSGSYSISMKDLFFVDLQDNRLEKLCFTESVSSCTIKCDNNQLKELVLPPVKGSGGWGLTCTNNLLQELGVIDGGQFSWKGSDVSLNPGKDGVFTIYVTEEPDSYWVAYLLDHWQWQGQDITVKFVTVPAE